MPHTTGPTDMLSVQCESTRVPALQKIAASCHVSVRSSEYGRAGEDALAP